MQLPKVVILSVHDINNENHTKTLYQQDYPDLNVRENVEDLNAAIAANSFGDIFVLTKTSQLIAKDFVSRTVGALLNTQGAAHVAYTDLIFVDGNTQYYSPQKAYDKLDFINNITTYQDCFVFSRAIWQTIEGFKPAPHPIYSFLLRASNHTIFQHIPSPLYYSYKNNLAEAKNELLMTRQAILG